MKRFTFDTETFLFAPGMMAPPPVCMTYCIDGGEPALEHANPAVGGRMREVFGDHLLSKDTLLVGHNVAYDLRVIAARWPELLEDIFLAYENDRVVCTQLRQQLLDIATGCFRGYMSARGKWVDYGYDLASLGKRLAGVDLDKDTWRKRYGELFDKPVSDWEQGAVEYPLLDAAVTDLVYLKQDEAQGPYLKDQYNQARYYWALGLASCWGIRTNARQVDKLEASVKLEYERLRADLVTAGLVRPDGSRDTKRAAARIVEVCEAKGKKPDGSLVHPYHLTDTGKPSLSAEACDWSGDDILIDYAEYGAQKYTFAAIDMLRSGTVTPIHTRFDLVASGRSSSSKPNIQNPRRMPGIRECFVPRVGCVFASADFDAFELRTLAQVCIKLLGKSKLADALNAGEDPHCRIAAQLLSIAYEEAIRRKEDKEDKIFDDARQTGKVANFGFPGGLGAAIIHFAKSQYNVILEADTGGPKDWRVLKNTWSNMWPEMAEYFHVISSLSDEDGYIQLDHLFSGRYRGGMFFTNACNTLFQGLASDAAKYCCWLVQRACYIERDSPLYGSRLVNFIHDELVVETPEEGAHEAAVELARLMKVGAGMWLPDVPPKTKPQLSRCYSKKAKPIYGPDGRLIPWEYSDAA